MLRASFRKYTFEFKRPGGTSRGVLTTKDSWHIFLIDSEHPEITGIGECSVIKNLSIDDRPDYEVKLEEVLSNLNNNQNAIDSSLVDFPSIRFGLEMALRDLEQNGSKILFPTAFTSGDEPIPINGLIWMGDYEFMRKQIAEKVDAGFRCIKIKIGAIGFEDELDLLHMIRKDFSADDLELRVDANGAFQPVDAMEKLKRLSDYDIHSIEQPIKQGQWDDMARLCQELPLPIALDEELIGVTTKAELVKMLSVIKPQYVILKPSLLGGWKQSELVISEAGKLGIGWWVTSALEGNIGLNAIAQWTATLNNEMPQGLGTGQLYTNNIPSPLFIENARLRYNSKMPWDFSMIAR